MNEATRDGLIRLAFLVAERIIIPLLERLIVGTTLTPEQADGTVQEIVRGIERDWPNLSGDEKRLIAFDAIEQMFRNRGGNPTAADINLALELAVAGVRK